MNSQQKSAIINFMDVNYKHLYGKHSGLRGPATKEKKWTELVEQLNLLGPPSKNLLSWQRCWIDMKSKLKLKVANSKQELKKTGGGPQTIIMSEDDIQMINIIKEENVSGLNVNESKVRNLKNVTSIEGLVTVPSRRDEIIYDLTDCTVEVLDVSNCDSFETIAHENEMDSQQISDSNIEVIHSSDTSDANQSVGISHEARDFLRASSSLAMNQIPSTSKTSKSVDKKVAKVTTPKSPKVNTFIFHIKI